MYEKEKRQFQCEVDPTARSQNSWYLSLRRNPFLWCLLRCPKKSGAYRQREDIAVGLCPNTGNPPCVGQKANLAKIGTVAQGGCYLKKKNKMKKNQLKRPILNPYLPRISLVSIVSDQPRQNCIHWEYLKLYLLSYFWEISKRQFKINFFRLSQFLQVQFHTNFWIKCWFWTKLLKWWIPPFRCPNLSSTFWEITVCNYLL